MDDIKRYDSFETENEFRAVREGLNRKVANGELLNLGLDENIKNKFNLIYESTADGTQYVLSHPDHAYRGYLKIR